MVESEVEQRKFAFCPRIAEFPLNDLIVECPKCRRFFAACCPDNSYGGDRYAPGQPTCHALQLVFVDGACSGNGLPNAGAGLGIAIGDDEDCSWSVPVDDTIDPGAPRTSQRAELLAAVEGLKKLHHENKGCNTRSARRHEGQSKATYIVVADSEYVVKGITEWFPSWKGRGWRTPAGKRPANLDLFLKLDEYTTTLEQEDIEVGFYRVPRDHNQKADALAKVAARF